MLRLLGLIFVLLGGLVWWSDTQGEEAAGADAPRLTEFGELWFDLHKESLIGLQSGLENRVSPDAFQKVEPILYEPASFVIGGFGLALWALSLLLMLLGAGRRREAQEW